MIIWKGRGILIPLLVIGGVVLGMMTSSLFSQGSNVPMLLGFWIGAALVWVFALTGLGKSQSQTLVDPKTMRPVVVEKVHSLYFLPPIAWAVVATLLAILMTTGSFSENDEPGPVADESASRAFREADHFLNARSAIMTSGNSPKAVQIAKDFSALAKEVRGDVIGKKESAPLKDFSAYAHLTSTQCTLLLRVPDLRNFTDEAKDTMVQVAWLSAQKVLGETAPDIQTLVVGVRGTLLYERALKGTLVEIDPEKPLAGVTEEIKTSKARDFLAAQFGAVADTSAVASASEVEDNGPKSVTQSNASVPKSIKDSETPPPAATAEPLKAPQTSEPAAPVALPMSKPESESEMPNGAVLPTEVREWKDSNGRPLRASLVRYVDEAHTIGEFKREDGKLFEIPIERFSVEDRAFLKPLSSK